MLTQPYGWHSCPKKKRPNGALMAQGMAVKRLLKNVTGSTIYWEAYSSDAAGRPAKSDVMSFVLTE